ncbi:hypothetical protein [Allokutzneria sp. NRRL B-24872]|uniref:hypothetical protein n=1 Tax=Allokutzneria sp. NRRL B-24872 TaxID=1137961 RepID=UPI0011782DBA|nr:hypothetical protein [Allokutzneria sp. NRRL B-24872]
MWLALEVGASMWVTVPLHVAVDFGMAQVLHECTRRATGPALREVGGRWLVVGIGNKLARNDGRCDGDRPDVFADVGAASSSSAPSWIGRATLRPALLGPA